MDIVLPLYILNNMPWVWLGLAVFMTILEGLTMGLTSIWLALGALAAMILAFFIPSVSLQVMIFLVLSIGMLLFTRPLAVRKFKIGGAKTNADRLVGMKAQVLKRVGFDESGQVRIRGQVWTARSSEAALSFDKGQDVVVRKIEGVTLIVEAPGPPGLIPEDKKAVPAE